MLGSLAVVVNNLGVTVGSAVQIALFTLAPE